MSGGVDTTATVLRTADGLVRVEADCPALASRSVELMVPRAFSGDLLALAGLWDRLPPVVGPLPPKGDLIRGIGDRIAWTSIEGEGRVLAIWELSPLAKDVRLTFRGLALNGSSGPEFVFGPDGVEVVVRAPFGWSSVHAEIVESLPGASTPRRFSTHVANRDGAMSVWIPSRCKTLRIHATDEVGAFIQRELEPPFSGTIVLQ